MSSSLEDSLEVLREGRSVNSIYNTTFLLKWPDHLGGEATHVTFEGSLVIIPTLGMA
ncbi:MAG TPA: hypothetical protein VF517_16225 [Thermoleophilaceae bacterium]